MDTAANLIQTVMQALSTPGNQPSTGVREEYCHPAKAEAVAKKAFEGFDHCGDPELSRMLQEALSLCADMTQSGPQRWLTLCGPSGTGKTRLARSCKRFWGSAMGLYQDIRTGATLERRSMFIEWGRALSWMVEGDYSFLRDLAEAPFVVLDDIGAEYSRLRELSTSKLYEVLCSRRYRWTVITANLGMEDIAGRLDNRIASRLLRDNSVVVELPAQMPDYNLRGD